MTRLHIVSLSAVLLLPSSAFAAVGAPQSVAWTQAPVRIDRTDQTWERLPPRVSPASTTPEPRTEEKSSEAGNSTPVRASSPRSP